MIQRSSIVRTLGALSSLAALLLTVTACGSGTGSEGGASDPVRVGILAPFSGVLAGSGPPIKESVNLWLSQHNNSIAGRPVKLYVADDKSTVDGEVAAARSLVERDRVSIVIGLVNSAGALAVRDYLARKKVLTLDVVANSDDLRSPGKNPYLFVLPPTPIQTASAAAVLANTLKYKNIDVIADNFVGARSWVDPLVSRFKELGGKAVSQQYPPFPTSDYAPFVSKVQMSSADAVVALMYGGDALAFLRQWRSFDVKLPLYSVGAMLEPTSTFLPATKGAAKGMYTYWNYSPAFPTQENTLFTQLYRDHLRRNPGAFDMQTFTALDFVAAAYEAVNSNTPNNDALAQALATIEVDTPVGKVSFNAEHGINWNMYLMQVGVDKNGEEAMLPQGPFVAGASAQQSVAAAQSNLRQLPSEKK
jgi:branched-chain amino acid transport system substrate-binding protein